MAHPFTFLFWTLLLLSSHSFADTLYDCQHDLTVTAGCLGGDVSACQQHVHYHSIRASLYEQKPLTQEQNAAVSNYVNRQKAAIGDRNVSLPDNLTQNQKIAAENLALRAAQLCSPENAAVCRQHISGLVIQYSILNGVPLTPEQTQALDEFSRAIKQVQ